MARERMATRVVCRLVIAVLALAGSVARAEVLQLRFNWAPIFCFAGSNNGVPKEFCGQDAEDSTPRLRRHRLSLLKPLNGQCSSVPAYDPSALSTEVRQHLACTNPSYVRSSNSVPSSGTVVCFVSLTRSLPCPTFVL